MTTEVRQFASPADAHAAAKELYEIAKHKTRGGAEYELVLRSVNDHRRHQLRKAFHGPVLRDIADQVWVLHPSDATRRVKYTKAAWKEFFRELFIPAVPMEFTTKDGEIRVRMLRRTTERDASVGLSDDEFAEFLLQVIAFAVLELGVIFREKEDEC